MLDDLYAAESDAAARDLIARPPPAPKPAPKFTAWSAIPRGVAVAAGEVGASLADLAGAAAAFRDTPSKDMDRGGLPSSAFSSDLGDSVRDYWRGVKPDPETASTAEQVLFGFSRGLAKLVPATIVAGPAGAVAAGIEEAMTVSDELRRQGVPEGARQIAGIIQGAGMASAALPLLGRTLTETAALYVVGGPGGFMAQQALTRKVLEHAGQERIAETFDPFDPVGLTVAALVPLVFTAAGLRAQKLRADAKAQADFIAAPRPSEPTPVAAAVAEAVRAPVLSQEVVDAAMVNNLRVAAADAAVRTLDYQIEHKPMTVDGGAATLDDLEPAFGPDIYGKDALQFFGSGDAREASVLRVLKRVRGKPDALVTIYRGVPEGVTKINPGDWVTLDKAVAADYGAVISMKVPAKHVTGWADSLLEFGYHPPQAEGQGARLVTGADGKTTLVTDAPEVAGADKAAYRQALTDGDGKAAVEALTRIREAEGRTITADDVATVEVLTAKADPIAKLNEPADATPKPLAAPLPDAVAARVADLEATSPDMIVRIADDGRPVTLAEDLAEVRRLAAEGTDDMLGTLDADLLQVAVNCALSGG